MNLHGDPTYAYHVAAANVLGLLSLRLCGHEDDGVAIRLNITQQVDATRTTSPSRHHS